MVITDESICVSQLMGGTSPGCPQSLRLYGQNAQSTVYRRAERTTFPSHSLRTCARSRHKSILIPTVQTHPVAFCILQAQWICIETGRFITNRRRDMSNLHGTNRRTSPFVVYIRRGVSYSTNRQRTLLLLSPGSPSIVFRLL